MGSFRSQAAKVINLGPLDDSISDDLTKLFFDKNNAMAALPAIVKKELRSLEGVAKIISLAKSPFFRGFSPYPLAYPFGVCFGGTGRACFAYPKICGKNIDFSRPSIFATPSLGCRALLAKYQLHRSVHTFIVDAYGDLVKKKRRVQAKVRSLSDVC
jgi:hypothetical protein